MARHIARTTLAATTLAAVLACSSGVHSVRAEEGTVAPAGDGGHELGSGATQSTSGVGEGGTSTAGAGPTATLSGSTPTSAGGDASTGGDALTGGDASTGGSATTVTGGGAASGGATGGGTVSAGTMPGSPNQPAWTFDTNTLSTAPDDAGQYPSCLTCGSQYYFGVAGCPAAAVGTSRPCQSYCHVKYGVPINYYLDDPPASGNHYPSPEYQLGEHATPVPRGYYVHSMEHGAVVLAFNCPSGCDAELAVLRQVVAQRSRSGDEVIMTPDPLMQSSRFAALSWTWIYTFDAPDLATLLCFVDQHQHHGRENKPL